WRWLLPVVGAGPQADPDADAALVEPPLVQLEGAQPAPDERVAVGDLPGGLLVGSPGDRHARPRPGGRPGRRRRPSGRSPGREPGGASPPSRARCAARTAAARRPAAGRAAPDRAA